MTGHYTPVVPRRAGTYPAAMPSLLDDPALSEGVFYPRPSFAPPPPGARDAMIEVAPRVRLGSACAAELARALPGALAGIVFESGFSDIDGFARRRGVPANVVPGEDRAVLSPLAKLAGSKAPLLVLHGEVDTLLPAGEGRAAYEASGAVEKRLVIVPGRGHNNVSAHPLYWQELAAFLGRVAGRGG
jgi:pimeloyl-ACP methyl ester carboxylesterase